METALQLALSFDRNDTWDGKFEGFDVLLEVSPSSHYTCDYLGTFESKEKRGQLRNPRAWRKTDDGEWIITDRRVCPWFSPADIDVETEVEYYVKMLGITHDEALEKIQENYGEMIEGLANGDIWEHFVEVSVLRHGIMLATATASFDWDSRRPEAERIARIFECEDENGLFREAKAIALRKLKELREDS